MVGVGCKRFLKLFIIFMVFMPVTFAFAAIEFSTENTIYRAASCGIVFLESPYSATSFTFSDGFLMFSNFNYGSGNLGSIGFSCLTETANMTVNVVEDEYLKYTVDAPSMVTSVTKIYCGNKGKPESVEGAYSWNFNSVSKILTISVFHNSPQTVEVGWKSQAELERYILNLGYFDLISLIPFIFVCGLVLGAIIKGTFDPEMVVALIVVSVVLSISLFLITSFYELFI